MTSLEQLEKWASENDGWFSIRQFWVHLEAVLGPEIIGYRCPSEMRDYHHHNYRAHCVVAGTDEQPANLDLMVEMVLSKWHKLKGGDLVRCGPVAVVEIR